LSYLNKQKNQENPDKERRLNVEKMLKIWILALPKLVPDHCWLIKAGSIDQKSVYKGFALKPRLYFQVESLNV